MKSYRVYDIKNKIYRNDICFSQDGRIIHIDEYDKKFTIMNKDDFIVERGFIGIFEGDIMKTDRQNRSGPVKFLDHLGLFTRKEGIISEGMYKLLNNKRKVEVIGNIHDK